METDCDGVDWAFDDQPGLHAALADLRRKRGHAVVPFAGTRAVLLLTQELVAAGFRDEETFPSWASYSLSTGPRLRPADRRRPTARSRRRPDLPHRHDDH